VLDSQGHQAGKKVHLTAALTPAL